jgi:hypothetical protein
MLQFHSFCRFKPTSIKAQDHLYQAENEMQNKTKEEIALRVIEYYAPYKAQKTIGNF